MGGAADEPADAAVRSCEQRYARLADRYRLVTEQSADIVFEADLDGALEWISPPVERVLGRAAESLAGAPPLQLLHPEDRARAEAVLVDIVGGGEPASAGDVRLQHQDGSYRWMAFTARPRLADGVVTGVVGSLRDVTAEHEAVASLEHNEAMYRALVENSADVVVHTVGGVVQWISPSVEHFVGWSADELIGETTAHLWHPDDQQAAVALRESVYAGEPGRAVLRFRTKTGHYIWVESTLRPVEPQYGSGMIGTLRDVTAQVEAEDALRRSEEQFRLLADHASDVVFMSGPDRRIRWIAPTVTRCLGWDPEELVGTEMGDLMHPDDLRDVEPTRGLVYNGADTAVPEGGYFVRMRSKSGEFRWMSGVPTVVKDPSGAVVGVVVGMRDVQELVAARDEAQRDRARLQATVDSLLDPHVRLTAVRDPEGAIVDFTCTEANQAACTYLRTTPEALQGARLTATEGLVAEGGLMDLLVGAMESGQPLELDDYVNATEAPPSAWRHYDLRGVRVADGLSVTWRDITDRQSSAAALAASEEQYRLLAENASDMVIRVLDGVVLWTSRTIVEGLGWSPDEIVGRQILDFVHPDDLSHVAAEQAIVEGGTATLTRLRLRAKDGLYHWAEAHGRPYLDARGRQDGLVVSTRIVDAEVASEQELEWRAQHDEVTGLLNRPEVVERLTWMGRHLRRQGDEYALCFCDIDNFKAINDEWGHAAGDVVLRAFATRITDAVRGRDIVARAGGDEILIVLDGVGDIGEAVAIAEKVRVAVKEPVGVEGFMVSATLSIGVTIAHAGEGVDEMVSRADRAMYKAKREGRDRVVPLTSCSE